jgi:hypothetical protein
VFLAMLSCDYARRVSLPSSELTGENSPERREANVLGTLVAIDKW